MQTVIYCLKKSFRDKNDFNKTTYLISIVKFSLVQYSYSIHGYRYTQCRYKECLNTEVSIPSYICHKKQSNYTHHAIVYTCVTYQDMKHILNLIAMEYIHEDWWKEIFCNALQNICKFTVQKLNNESIVWWKMNENVCFFLLLRLHPFIGLCHIYKITALATLWKMHLHEVFLYNSFNRNKNNMVMNNL